MKKQWKLIVISENENKKTYLTKNIVR
jgi:hypothetical protein